MTDLPRSPQRDDAPPMIRPGVFVDPDGAEWRCVDGLLECCEDPQDPDDDFAANAQNISNEAWSGLVKETWPDCLATVLAALAHPITRAAADADDAVRRAQAAPLSRVEPGTPESQLAWATNEEARRNRGRSGVMGASNSSGASLSSGTPAGSEAWAHEWDSLFNALFIASRNASFDCGTDADDETPTYAARLEVSRRARAAVEEHVSTLLAALRSAQERVTELEKLHATIHELAENGQHRPEFTLQHIESLTAAARSVDGGKTT